MTQADGFGDGVWDGGKKPVSWLKEWLAARLSAQA